MLNTPSGDRRLPEALVHAEVTSASAAGHDYRFVMVLLFRRRTTKSDMRARAIRGMSLASGSVRR